MVYEMNKLLLFCEIIALVLTYLFTCSPLFVCLFSNDRTYRLPPHYTNGAQWIANGNLHVPVFKFKSCLKKKRTI